MAGAAYRVGRGGQRVEHRFLGGVGHRLEQRIDAALGDGAHRQRVG